MLVQSFIDRVRPLVGIKSWDYIVLWKLSNDQRCMELMDCCCAGSSDCVENGGDGLSFEASSNFTCRDVMLPHPRMVSCDLLQLLPSSMLLDSGVHAQTLISNQTSWLNYSHTSDSSLSQETIGTRVLVPLSLGLLELFVAKQVPQDEQVIEFIKSQSNFFLEHQTSPNSSQKDPITLFQHQISPEKENFDNLPHEISMDRIHLSSPLLHNPNNNNMFLDDQSTAYNESSAIFTPPAASTENGFNDQFETTQSNMISASSTWINEPIGTVEDQTNEDSFIGENNRSDDSDPNEDEDDGKYRRRTGKGQSKNLEAERKRRKKLNDRLYSLRALVPKISKLDRASILGDAIDYVKELQKQVKDLQIELEEQSDDEDNATNSLNDTESNVPPSNAPQLNRTKHGPKRENDNFMNGFHDKGHSTPNNISNQNHELDNTNDKVQQMEPQVQVFQLDGNDFLVKVFCEHKSGGFVRLMEALNSLGLEVTNVNVTRHTCLVSSNFKVERKNDEMVQADHVKESLLELTRNPSRMWMGDHRECAQNIIHSNSSMDNDYDYNSLLHSHCLHQH